MEKQNKKKAKRTWLIVLLIFVLVAISIAVLSSRLQKFLPNDEGAISINEDDGSDDGSGNENGDISDGSLTSGQGEEEVYANLEVTDDKTVWTTNTAVEIFRISYENDTQDVTVNSDCGDNLIAPGTEQSYTFKLKNTGDVALDYSVKVEAWVTPGEVEIPVEVRLSSYDGRWIAGSADTYEDIENFDGTKDYGTLGSGKYGYYTLDWQWPFEGGDDEWDTMLGNMAVEQDLVLTMMITTYAEISDDPSNIGGLTPPQTGDDSKLVLWCGLAGVCVFFIIILLIYWRRDDEEEEKMEAQQIGRS